MTHITPSRLLVDRVRLVKKKVRFIVVKGVKYLRQDDVADYIRDLGGGEETDVRNRLNEAARNLDKG